MLNAVEVRIRTQMIAVTMLIRAIHTPCFERRLVNPKAIAIPRPNPTGGIEKARM